MACGNNKDLKIPKMKLGEEIEPYLKRRGLLIHLCWNESQVFTIKVNAYIFFCVSSVSEPSLKALQG